MLDVGCEMNSRGRTNKLMRYLNENPIMSSRNANGDIEMLDLRSDDTTDEVLALLHELPSLRRITLQATQVTDDGLSSISQLVQLEELDLRSCKRITDAGLEHVARISALKRLELYDTNTSDDGLSCFAQLMYSSAACTTTYTLYRISYRSPNRGSTAVTAVT